MIKITNLLKIFNNEKIIDKITFEINRNECISIIGPSGAGKSTLVKILSGLESFDQGTIKINQKEYSNIVKNADIGFVFQDFNLFENMTIEENILYAAKKKYFHDKEILTKNYNLILDKFQIRKIKDNYQSNISGGQKQRVAIARALILDPKIIIFDEPTSALDPENIFYIKKEIEELKKIGINIIVVTHDINFAKKISDKIMFLENGKILDFQETKIFFTKYLNVSESCKISSFLDKLL